MKGIIFILVMIVAAASIILLTSANGSQTRLYKNGRYADDRFEYCATKTSFGGHKYVLFYTYKNMDAVHDPDCPCHKLK